MQLTYTQLGMELMIRGSHPIMPDTFPDTTQAEWIAWGRHRLIECTGKDFGYDLNAWHQYLIKTDDAEYHWSDGHLRFPKAIEAALANKSWQKAVATAESKCLYEKISADARQKKEAEEFAKRTWAGKFRTCPKCQTSFKSIKDRGQCPKCRHLFRASQSA